MKKIILILVLSLFTANVYADSHVKRILSTSQTGKGNDIVYPTGKAKIDGAFSIEDKESLPILYDLIKNEGLSLGTSCGVNIAGAIRLGKKLGPGKTIVTILCDKSDRYNSKMFNKPFLIEKGLPYPDWI